VHPRDRFWRIVLPTGAIAVLSTLLAVGYATEPDRFARGYSPRQPIAFSHRLHAGDNHVPCLYCHTGAERSRHAGVPAVETCMNCHAVTRTDKPEVQRVIAAFKANQPIAWQRIYALPDHVYFDHRPHVGAGIACQSCHGEVQTMEQVSREMLMRMGVCLSCHRDPHEAVPAGSKISSGPTNCFACHR
jgi:Cytochrome c7 and related cytochrome c/Class III cytochrome C family